MLANGTILAGYRVEDVIGQGGMGVVYRATQLSLERAVALKVLAETLSKDDSFRERFRREGMIQAGIDHPHIVPVFQAGESKQGLFLAMRLVHGPTLKDLIVAPEFDPARALRLLAQVAGALDSAHEAGLVHRDVKPQNILVGRGDHAYLADFGLTKPLGTRGLTRTGEFMGSLDYISPEQIRGESPTPLSDVYSFAAVLYEALTGTVPYPLDSDAAVLYAHLSEPPPSPSARRPSLPSEFDGVIAAGMAKEPEERPDSCGELVRRADAALGAAVAAAVAEEPRPARVRPGPTRATPPTMPTDVENEAEESATPPPGETRASPAGPTRTSPRPAAGPTALSPPRDEPVPRTRRRRYRGIAIALGAAAIVGALAGTLLAAGVGSGDDPATTAASPAAPKEASGSMFSLRYPAQWRPAGEPDAIPGLALADGIALERRGTDAGLVAGTTSASGPTLLPPDFMRRLDGAPARDAVKVGALEGYRYSGLGVDGVDGVLNVYVVPTDRGVVTIACRAPSAGDALEECEQIAGSTSLDGAKAYRVGPNAAYARALRSAVQKLEQARTEVASAVGDAPTTSAARAPLTAAASAYRSTAAALRRRMLSPEVAPANAAIVAAIRGVASAYGKAADAAGADDRAAYNAARADVSKAERALTAALRRLSALGYSTGR